MSVQLSPALAIEPLGRVLVAPRPQNATVQFGGSVVVSPSRSVDVLASVERRDNAMVFVLGLAGRLFSTDTRR